MLYEVITAEMGCPEPRFPARSRPPPALQAAGGGRGLHARCLPRITSYNVCYTKLLRVFIDSAMTNGTILMKQWMLRSHGTILRSPLRETFERVGVLAEEGRHVGAGGDEHP